MQNEFEKYLKNVCKCSFSDRYLLAVSGGIDSVVMAHLFHLSGLSFAMAHCNFHLRAEESDGDQQFVEEMAVRLSRSCYIKDFNTQAFANEQGISVQMAARDLRYAWFGELAEKHGYNCIAIAHNQNDVIETVILNFARGTGIRGLTGIKPRLGKVIRPLLFASRHEILQFARLNNLLWREDSSNEQIKYTRNRIRHEIIPEFEIINPSFVQNAMDTIGRLEQVEQLFDHMLALVRKAVFTEMPDRYLIDIEKLQKFPAVESLLFELLRPFGCNQLNVKSLLESFSSIPGKRFITRTHNITRDRSQLIITRNVIPDNSEVLIDSITTLISNPVNLTFSTMMNTVDFVIPVEPRYAALDADTISYPLTLRIWKPGDNFQPLGLKGSKKISDYLINNKIALPDKQHVWVLETGGRIVWVVNHRIDNRFRITANTRNILIIEFRNREGKS
jgi:tRNA(Ile)-lysidine synthase